MINRRSFICTSTAAGAAALTRQAWGAEPLKELPTDNPQAQALKYTEDVQANAPEGYPQGSAQTCANCLHYKPVDDSWGSCALFPTFKVRAEGWCSAWVKQA